jgi:hypothetical protein
MDDRISSMLGLDSLLSALIEIPPHWLRYKRIEQGAASRLAPGRSN